MIKLNGLTKKYPNTLALDGVSLNFSSGEVVAVLGPNGSGKSTMLKCISGLIRPTSGSVQVDGYSPVIEQSRAQQRVSYLPQHPELPTRLSVRETVEFYRKLRQLPVERTDWALEAVGMKGAEHKRVHELSGGMGQRVALAVALLPRADYLLLDEPTARLDPEAHALLFELLRGMAEQNTENAVVYATHILSDVVNFADRVVFLQRGAVVADLHSEALEQRLAALEELHLEVDGQRERAGEIARDLGASEVSTNGSGILVRIDRGTRARLVRELEERGVSVTGLEMRGGELNELYREFQRSGNGGGEA